MAGDTRILSTSNKLERSRFFKMERQNYLKKYKMTISPSHFKKLTGSPVPTWSGYNYTPLCLSGLAIN
jgi:hypothetical protein